MIPMIHRSPLTERQEEILQMVADGISTEDIAAKLYLVPHTVKKHIWESFPRLGASDRTHAVAICMRAGWVV